MTDAEIIEALGGTAEVARKLKKDSRVVSNWKSRGISGVGRYLIRELAAQAKIKLPADFMSRAA